MVHAELEPLHDALVAYLPRLVADLFSDAAQVDQKGADGLDFVTALDLSLQAQLETDLAALLPGSRVVGEEGFAKAALSDTGDIWLVDPLDGTVNFVAGLPAYAVAVALIRDGQTVLAAVHDIRQSCTYSALAGGGARRDGKNMSPKHHPARLAVVSSGLLKDLAGRDPGTLTELLDQFKLRNLGCQSLHLCLAAAGAVAMVASREAKAWDDIAGALIAREAGLKYGHYSGNAAPAPDADQYSLCCHPTTFDTYAGMLARSARPSGKDIE